MIVEVMVRVLPDEGDFSTAHAGSQEMVVQQQDLEQNVLAVSAKVVELADRSRDMVLAQLAAYELPTEPASRSRPMGGRRP